MTQPKDGPADPPFPGTPPPVDTPDQCAAALCAAAAGFEQLAVTMGDRTAMGPPANIPFQLTAAAALMRKSAAHLLHVGVDPAHPGAEANGVTPPHPGDPDPRTGNVLVSPGPTAADATPPAGRKRQ